MKKVLVLILLLLALAFSLWLTGGMDLSLEGLRRQLAGFEMLRTEHPVFLALGFLFVYVVIAALSLPLAVPMTLLIAALFGLFWGTIITSFASSLGALASFLVSRYLLKDLVQSRFGSRLAAINHGIARNGIFYLFTLRLIPAFPFFLINIAMGLTQLPAWKFYLISQIGMLPGTLVYVNAGTQLATIKTLSGILSPGIIGSFVLIGIFPWLARRFITWLKAAKTMGRFVRPKHFDRNLIVIGGGSAGLVSAYVAAAVKAKVTLVEGHQMGGDCLNTGCVPSKALIRSARLAHEMAHADRYGLTPVTPDIDFSSVFARISTVISAIEPHDSVERYQGLGVDARQGRAFIIDPYTVEITALDGSVERLTTRAIIVATGASPLVPPIPGLAEIGYLTSETLWAHFGKLKKAPGRIAILGGGPIGIELAQALSRLGAKVTVLEQAPRILAREDVDVASHIAGVLESEGVILKTGHQVTGFQTDGQGGKFATANGENGPVDIGFDEVIVAVGRKPRLEGFGLEALGLTNARRLETNAYLETLYPNILAAGDVTSPLQLTHMAGHQAWHASVNALFGAIRRFKVDERFIPRVTFSDPEIARIGLGEAEALEVGIEVEITRYDLSDLDRAIADGAAAGFVKILTPKNSDRILGVTIVGAHAGELLAEFTLAMKHGLGLGKILSTIHPYPTWSESAKMAAGTWRRAHVSPTILTLLSQYHKWRRG